MVDTVTIPLGGLNAIPGVQGIDDVTFDIPQVNDIVDAVRENTIEPIDVGRAVVNEVRAGNLPGPDDVADEIDRAIDSIVGDLDESVTDLQTELETFIDESLGILETDVQNLREGLAADIEEIVGTVSDEFDSLSALVEDRVLPAVDGVENALTDELADVRSNVETAIDESTEDLDEAVDGVSGALASLGDTLGNVRDDVQTLVENVETTLDRLPEDFETAVGNGVESVEPTVDESGLFSEPVAFVSGVIREGLDAAVDDETAQALSDAVE